jgi:acyl-CoA thioester hydrolase
MIEIGLGSAQSWECDFNGHLNLRYHVAYACNSIAPLAVALGLGPRHLRNQGLELSIIDHHIRFLREIRAATPFVFTGGVIDLADDRLRFYQEMRNALTGEIAATFIAAAGLFDQATHAPRRLPEKAVERAQRLTVQVPDHGAPRGLAHDTPRSAPTWEDADRLRLYLTHLGALTADECDSRGLILPHAFVGRIFDGHPHYAARTEGYHPADAAVGTVVLEARVVYRTVPRQGEALALRSGLKTTRGKTAIKVHWLFNLETGEPVATGEVLTIFLDLATRKSIEPDAARRRRMEEEAVPELSA